MQSLLNFKAFVEPLHDPCLIIRVRLASTFVLRFLSKPSCRWVGSDVRPLLPRRSWCGGGVGRWGYDGVLEEDIIIVVCFYRNRTPWEHVNIIIFKFLFNMSFVSLRLVNEVWTHLYRICNIKCVKLLFVDHWQCTCLCNGTFALVLGELCWLSASKMWINTWHVERWTRVNSHLNGLINNFHLNRV